MRALHRVAMKLVSLYFLDLGIWSLFERAIESATPPSPCCPLSFQLAFVVCRTRMYVQSVFIAWTPCTSGQTPDSTRRWGHGSCWWNQFRVAHFERWRKSHQTMTTERMSRVWNSEVLVSPSAVGTYVRTRTRSRYTKKRTDRPVQIHSPATQRALLYGRTTTAMHNMSTPPPSHPPSSCLF